MSQPEKNCLPTEPFWEAIAAEEVEERLEFSPWGGPDPDPSEIPPNPDEIVRMGDCVYAPWS